MKITIAPIMGFQIGFEFCDGEIDNHEIGYFLLDMFIVRIQFAWYKQ
tara:strand:- start:1927 stop:2067 length:141 start_codon:yes stop_codon:yes gene_type:complete